MKRGWPAYFVLPLVLSAVTIGAGLSSCGSGTPSVGTGKPTVVAVTTYLADITRNVAGSRVEVESLIPEGADSHSFEPTPRDARLLAEGRLVIVDVLGLTPLVDGLIEGSAHQDQLVIEAASGLAGLPADQSAETDDGQAQSPPTGGIDPHFWLDPVSVITYVENIREGLIAVDPDGADSYRANADAYITRLKDLDAWIVGQVAAVPASRRLLVTNHEEFSYFAARYGFTVVGTVFPTVSAEGAPSARQLAALVGQIRASGAPAIFLDTGTNAALADEVARETGVVVVNDLYTHSLGENATTYIDMMRWDVGRIVEALR